MFVEEEQIFYPHQRSSLAHAAEEAIDDAGGEVRVKGGRGCRPRTGSEEDGLEDECNR